MRWANRHCRVASASNAVEPSRENWGVVEQRFHIEDRVEEGVPVVAVYGEIDVATAPELRESLHTVIVRGTPTVVVDLLGVTFLDSTALGVLVGGLKRCRELGGEFHIVVADTRIRKIFEITGLDRVFTLSESLTTNQAS
jgi:anti-sigma B factor antagonist